MKVEIRYYTLRLCLAVFFLASNVMLFAQPPGGTPPGGGGTTGDAPPCWTPECVPIDGGIGFLIAAGAAIGVKKLYGKKA
ncbi:PID-CTERM protein-sorting domain-containing protein [Crocinitomix catalasitica]|uniref:PID-CTERM protein-sorting domain-containing protein n=1 Tax=Crocinitomix catalasitica TaxID=184607 RepID=UPI0012F8DAA1|nr:hypothetical protein [Crocinitomix catalasitica]